ncbi:hypothetical protein [Heyndrickxia acidicola]|uniref:hypothetical protein n=1 Tax=Heyndrickxia acidicola TaxID=209389 RepID=UPI000825BD86|nr:hypothetical protein [Heyndrickxia acidicola]
MSFEKEVIKYVNQMDNMEAKEALGAVFTKFLKIGKNGYTKEDCFKEIEVIYRDFTMKVFIK